MVRFKKASKYIENSVFDTLPRRDDVSHNFKQLLTALFLVWRVRDRRYRLSVMAKKQPEQMAELELNPDGWERFERAVDAAVKSGPKHRQRTHVERKERPASKEWVHKGN
jgi:hypothetical protein